MTGLGNIHVKLYVFLLVCFTKGGQHPINNGQLAESLMSPKNEKGERLRW